MKIIENKVKGGGNIARLKLRPFQGNLKKENKELIQQLENNIIKNGFRAPIFVWYNKDNYILDGHQRLKALNELFSKGYSLQGDQVPVVNIIAETEKEAREIVMEQHSRYSEFDMDVLPDFVEGLDLGDIPILELDELKLNIEDDKVELDESIDAVPEVEENIVVKKGGIFKLGEHYLMCGDSISDEDVGKLMNDEKA